MAKRTQKGDPFEDWVPAKEAAKIIGISYETLMARIKNKPIESRKMGWSVYLHVDIVEAERLEQVAKDNSKKSKK